MVLKMQKTISIESVFIRFHHGMFRSFGFDKIIKFYARLPVFYE